LNSKGKFMDGKPEDEYMSTPVSSNRSRQVSNPIEPLSILKESSVASSTALHNRRRPSLAPENKLFATEETATYSSSRRRPSLSPLPFEDPTIIHNLSSRRRSSIAVDSDQRVESSVFHEAIESYTSKRRPSTRNLLEKTEDDADLLQKNQINASELNGSSKSIDRLRTAAKDYEDHGRTLQTIPHTESQTNLLTSGEAIVPEVIDASLEKKKRRWRRAFIYVMISNCFIALYEEMKKRHASIQRAAAKEADGLSFVIATQPAKQDPNISAKAFLLHYNF
jgi:hypothetical protein